MAASSSSNEQQHVTEKSRNWLDLPREVTAAILLKLGAVEILRSAQSVCTSWRSISMDPTMWRSIDMQKLPHHFPLYDLKIMCRHAVDRSCGGLVDISIECFATDDLLKYITDSTSHLRRLRLARCYYISDEGLCGVAEKLPLLEELDISKGNLTKDSLEVIGQKCPHIKSLKFNIEGFRCLHDESDDEAFAIANTMPGLRHLQLLGCKLTNVGLCAILDGCSHLESLDLRECFHINLEGSLGKRCAEQIKDLQLPNLADFVEPTSPPTSPRVLSDDDMAPPDVSSDLFPDALTLEDFLSFDYEGAFFAGLNPDLEGMYTRGT